MVPVPETPRPTEQPNNAPTVTVGPAQPVTIVPPVATPPPVAVVRVPRNWGEVFTAIRAGRWAEAQAGIASLPQDILTPVAKAELYTAKGSPVVSLGQVQALLTEAPDLPQTDQLARMALARGAPYLSWLCRKAPNHLARQFAKPFAREAGRRRACSRSAAVPARSVDQGGRRNQRRTAAYAVRALSFLRSPGRGWATDRLGLFRNGPRCRRAARGRRIQAGRIGRLGKPIGMGVWASVLAPQRLQCSIGRLP